MTVACLPFLLMGEGLSGSGGLCGEWVLWDGLGTGPPSAEFVPPPVQWLYWSPQSGVEGQFWYKRTEAGSLLATAAVTGSGNL